MFFAILGYICCVLMCGWLTLVTLLLLFFGGGDCGPLFGNWRHKGDLPVFFFILALTCFAWFLAIKYCPFTFTVGVLQ